MHWKDLDPKRLAAPLAGLRELDRRRFLQGSALGAAGLGLGLPRVGRAAKPTADDLRFVFVFAQGGWDVTRVYAPEFDNGSVDMEAAAEPATLGDITYVDHPDRPSVRAFFEANHHRMALVRGVLVRSIAHDICTMLAMTGTSSGFDPDWPAILAAARGDRHTLPHLVLAGPSFPGELVTSVARTGQSGQLEALLSGDIMEWNDQFVSKVPTPFENAIDRYVQRRVAAREQSTHSPVDQRLAREYAEATRAAAGLKDYRYVMDFSTSTDLGDQAAVAADALRLGLARSVTLGFAGAGGLGWDSHADNDNTQSQLFEALFQGLTSLMAQLDGTPGAGGFAGSLADQTVVVVLSEMARTPQLNATLGKDHWPYTSMMLLGPGLAHGRVIGGYDDVFGGATVDLASGGSGDTLISAEAVGAALLQLADIDPAEWVSGTGPLTAVLS
ncbi:MAG: DUF1501 domain-containing protein [Alphaproteobacteria bacterium]|nr:DUF1501 domain-containing protein [Alphaproteobacteria bacterium]